MAGDVFHDNHACPSCGQRRGGSFVPTLRLSTDTDEGKLYRVTQAAVDAIKASALAYVAMQERAERAEAERDEARGALRWLVTATLSVEVVPPMRGRLAWTPVDANALDAARALVEGWGDA